MSDSESESDFEVQKNKKKVTKKISKPAAKKGAAAKKKNTKTKGKAQTKGKSTNSKSKGKSDKDDEKADFLPGQKQETPDENDSSRVFYQSLYEQNNESFIAMKYCLEKGLIPEDEISKVQKKLEKLKQKTKK